MVVPMNEVAISIRGPLSDEEINALHALAFGHPATSVPWRDRLEKHSLFWVTARQHGSLVGFVNIIGDGGAHAVLLDTCVHPRAQRQGIGAALVRAAAEEARRLGCQWLHADYESRLVPFYEGVCRMQHTEASLLKIDPPG